MKTDRYTPEEIDRELACYPTQPGINKAGDIMRQLRADLAAKGEEAKQYVGLLEEVLLKFEQKNRIGKLSTRLESQLALKRFGRAIGKAREALAARTSGKDDKGEKS